MNDEIRRIYNEVKNLKMKAEDLFLRKRIYYIYNYLMSGAWCEDYGQNHKLVLDACCNRDLSNESDLENSENESKYKLQEKYGFKYKSTQFIVEIRGESATVWYSIALKKQDKKVFEMILPRNHYELCDWSREEWEDCEICLYIDGQWTSIIIELSKEVDRYNEEVKIADFAENIDDFKRSFGIE
ncbi:MAG: hypothetical protein HQL29_01865 [Candidatus Omnitrophica bacterium]|nr:hypothetical protein [Candidatus Omnitrophota bacterium]